MISPFIAAAAGVHLRLRPIALAFADRPPEDRHLGYVLEVRQDRGEAQSLRGPGLPRNGLSHAIHQLKLISFGIFESRYFWPPMKYICFYIEISFKCSPHNRWFESRRVLGK